ncbi:MFS transporter [candidate division WOR-3 bacterium]|nr:MFS transporter [candidate division WOR-3 bacterium]
MKFLGETSKKTFFCISSFQALAMFRRGLFYTYLSIYLRYFLGLSVTETTLFATIPMILNVLFQTFVWGPISDKFQKRRTLIILGETSASVLTFFVWLFHTFPSNKHIAGYVVIIGLTIVEIFWSMSNVGWTAIISDLYKVKDRIGIQGKLSSIGAIGNFIGVWIGGMVYDGMSKFYNGWGFYKGLLFLIASGVMLISTIPMFFIPEGGIEQNPKGAKGTDDVSPRIEGLFSYSKPFLIFILAMVFINFGRNSIALIKPQYLTLKEGFNVSSSLLSYIVNVASMAVFLMGLIIGKLSKRFSDRILLLIGCLIATLYLFGFILAKSLTVIFVSNFFGGISDVIIFSSSYSFASKLIPPEHRGKQFALFNATFFLSWGVAGTFIAGPIVDLLVKAGKTQNFSYRMSFLSAAILVLLGILILLYSYHRFNSENGKLTIENRK